MSGEIRPRTRYEENIPVWKDKARGRGHDIVGGGSGGN